MGEWHTHPQLTPIPSPVDKALLNKCYKNKNITDIIFMIILWNQGELYFCYKNKSTGTMREIKDMEEK